MARTSWRSVTSRASWGGVGWLSCGGGEAGLAPLAAGGVVLGVGGDAGFVGDGEVLSAAVFFGFEEGVEGGLVGEPVLFAAEEDAVAGG